MGKRERWVVAMVLVLVEGLGGMVLVGLRKVYVNGEGLEVKVERVL